MRGSFLEKSVVMAGLLGLAGCSEDNPKKTGQVTVPEVDQATQVRKAVEEAKTEVPKPEAFDLEAQKSLNETNKTVYVDPTHQVEPVKAQESHASDEPKVEAKVEPAPVVAKEAKSNPASSEEKREKQQDRTNKKSTVPTSTKANDENPEKTVKQLIEELEVLQPGAPCVKWIKNHAATRIIGNKLLEKKTLSEEDAKHFRETVSEFIAANVKTFLPLIKDYTVEKVSLSRETKRLKNFALVMREKSTQELIHVEVLATTNGLRIIDIIVKETSLRSILQTSFDDILQSKTPKESWNRFLKGEKIA